jgi:cobalamin biosynthesis protein CobT
MAYITLDNPIGALKTQLSKLLMSVDRVGWNTGNTTGRFDVRRVSRLLAGSERVFKQRTESAATTTAVSIIIDISGSMQCRDREDGSDSLDTTRIGVASQCAWAIGTAVERSNCEVEVVGFGSAGNSAITINDKSLRGMDGETIRGSVSGDSTYTPTKLVNIKNYGTKMSSRKVAFQRMFEACRYGTADYQAVRTIVEQLSQRPEHRKIAIVLTDGCGDMAVLRKFCDMSEKLYDIPILAVGIQSYQRDMENSYKRFVMVNNLSDLVERAIKQLIDQIKK